MDLGRGVALLVGIGVASGALGWAAGAAVSTEPPGAVPAVAADAPTTTAAEEGPLRITLAGDSVMAGLAPALTAALEGGGDAEVQFVLTPSVLRDATVRFTWARELEDFDPDVVVMLVGTWELGEVTNGVGASVGTSDPTWQTAYGDEILDPWVDLVTASGARVLWLGAPAVATEEVSVLFAELNQTYQDLADRRDDVDYLETTEALAGPDGGFVDVDVDAQGRPVRLRQVDGLHLCPDGAVRLAEAVIEVLRRDRALAVPVGWENAGWRDDEEYPPGNCPPV